MTTIIVTDRDQVEFSLKSGDSITLMEVLRDEGMGVEAVCGGQCACATCHCYIDHSWMDRMQGPGEDELELLSVLEQYDPTRSRLSCQIDLNAGLDGLRATVAPEE